MTWMIDRTNLDQDQRTFIDNALQPGHHCFAKGPAGAGKSVVLVHSVLSYREQHPDAKIGMVLFTRSLIDMMGSALPTDANIQYFTTYQFSDNHDPWDLIAVDEIQDIKEDILNQIFRQARKVLIAGDFGQSIYDYGCSPDRIDLHNLETRSFPTIYRLTPKIKRIAGLFAESPQEFEKYHIDKRVNNTSIQRVKNRDRLSDLRFAWRKARKFAEGGYNTAVILPNNRLIQNFADAALDDAGRPRWTVVYDQYRKPDYENLNQYLQNHQLPLQIIGRGAGSMRQADADNLVSAITYHSAKGLDFEALFIPCLDNNTTIWRDNAGIERRLFFVALTRCRQDLFLSYSSQPHPFLAKIPDHYVQIQDNTRLESNEDNSEDEASQDFDF